MKNRLLKAVVLASLVAILLSCFVACAGAGNANSIPKADAANGDGWAYADNKLTIKKDLNLDAKKPEDVKWSHLAPSVTSVVFELADNETVTTIGDYAFHGMRNLKEIKLPDTVTSIGKCAFAFCSSLEAVAIPEGVTAIGESAFEGCAALKNAKIPATATALGSRAFAFCYSLEKVEVVGKIAKIESKTFWNCAALTTVLMREKDIDKAADAFEGAGIAADKITENGRLGETIKVTIYHRDAALPNEYIGENKEERELPIGSDFVLESKNLDGYTVAEGYESKTYTVTGDPAKDVFEVKYNKIAEKTDTAPAPAEKMPTWKIVMFVIILVLVIAAIVLGIVLYVRNSKKSANGASGKSGSKGADKKEKKSNKKK